MVSSEADVEQYKMEKTHSAKLFNDAQSVIPGGVTANIKHFSPYPIFMKAGHGSKLIDEDDTEYIDYSLCYGALITGHGHKKVTEATTKQLHDSGTIIFGTPHDLEIKMAKKIIEHYPSMDQVRFTNSGTEAILLAIRLAIAFTNKPKVAKFEGHYHGGLNQVLFSVNPSEENAGDPEEPTPVMESAGIPDHEKENTIVLPFNDLAATEKIIRKHADSLACVVIEPVQGGFIAPDESFIKGLSKLTNELGIVLIFDEVKTGFRTALGGAQELYGIKPDLTALGKVLGGGFPVGAIGGREDIMQLSAATAKSDVFAVGDNSDKTQNVVFHSGTYNGHPFAMAAGLATVSLLEDGLIDILFSHTMYLRRRLEKLYASYHIDMQTIGVGSIFNIVFTKAPVKNYRDMLQADTAFRQEIDLELLNLGVYLKPLNRYSMSIAHTLDDIEKTVLAHEKAINTVLDRKYKNSDEMDLVKA